MSEEYYVVYRKICEDKVFIARVLELLFMFFDEWMKSEYFFEVIRIWVIFIVIRTCISKEWNFDVRVLGSIIVKIFKLFNSV